MLSLGELINQGLQNAKPETGKYRNFPNIHKTPEKVEDFSDTTLHPGSGAVHEHCYKKLAD